MTQRYDTYKDSGIQWLGEIPGHWGCVRLKNVASFISGYAFDSNSFSIEGEVPVIRISDIQNDTVSFENCVYVPYNNKLSVFETKDDDLLIAMSGATTGKTGLVKGQYGYINQRVGIIRSEYIHLIKYSLRMPSFMDYIMLQAEGSAQPNISATGINQFYIPLPPLPEQHAIVSYLDDKCGKIDEWIEKKQKEVELLGEMKQRVIADAVTRGLNPNVTMKATNIPWLPEVPEHWEVKRSKYLLKLLTKSTKRIHKIGLENIESVSGKYIPSDTIFDGDGVDFDKGDILYGKLRPYLNKVWLAEFDGNAVGDFYVYRVINNYNNAYAKFFLMSSNFVGISNASTYGAKMPRVSSQFIHSLHFPVPPLSEQRAIVSYITERTAKIDRMVENVNREIENLKEYKQRLISDVVTGQIKVC